MVNITAIKIGTGRKSRDKLNPFPKIGNRMKRGIKANDRLTMLEITVEITNTGFGIYILLNKGPLFSRQWEDATVLWAKKFQS